MRRWRRRVAGRCGDRNGRCGELVGEASELVFAPGIPTNMGGSIATVVDLEGDGRMEIIAFSADPEGTRCASERGPETGSMDRADNSWT